MSNNVAHPLDIPLQLFFLVVEAPLIGGLGSRRCSFCLRWNFASCLPHSNRLSAHRLRYQEALASAADDVCFVLSWLEKVW